MLAEKLGCTLIQLSIAWSLKHEPVHCLLIGAKTTEELHQNLQALQVTFTIIIIHCVIVVNNIIY